SLYYFTQLLFQEQGTQSVKVTGTWTADFETQKGLQKYTFTFTQDGAAVSAKASVDANGDKRDVRFQEGKVEGDKLTFVELRDIGGKELRVTFTGKVFANEIKLTRKAGDFGSSEATAKRVEVKKGAGASLPTGTSQLI